MGQTSPVDAPAHAYAFGPTLDGSGDGSTADGSGAAGPGPGPGWWRGGVVRCGEWAHVAITNNGLIARTLVNGRQVAWQPVPAGERLHFDSKPLVVGGPLVRVPGLEGESNAHGELSEVRLWERELGERELLSKMHRRL